MDFGLEAGGKSHAVTSASIAFFVDYRLLPPEWECSPPLTEASWLGWFWPLLLLSFWLFELD
jgi:hypothetical protein